MAPSSHPSVTADNYGPLVNVLGWILIAFSGCTVLGRLIVKLKIATVGTDDLLIFVSLFAVAGYSATTSIEVANGLGQHMSTLSDPQIQRYQQARYAGQILYVIAITANELSTTVFLRLMTLDCSYKLARVTVQILLSFWGLSSVFATAFQCQLPNLWVSVEAIGNCVNQYAFQMTYDSLNIAFEAVLSLLPIAIIWTLQISISHKISASFCFSSRLLVIATIATHVHYLASTQAQDVTFERWPAAVCAIFVLNSGLLAASIPYLKPVLLGLQSGMIRSDDMRRRQLSLSGYYRYPKQTESRDRGKNKHIGRKKSIAQDVMPLRVQDGHSITQSVTDSDAYSK